MEMTAFKKKALREMNTRFLVMASFISLIFVGIYFGWMKFFRYIAEDKTVQEMNLLVYLSMVANVIFFIWALIMLLLFLKWAFRQYIARR